MFIYVLVVFDVGKIIFRIEFYLEYKVGCLKILGEFKE